MNELVGAENCNLHVKVVVGAVWLGSDGAGLRFGRRSAAANNKAHRLARFARLGSLASWRGYTNEYGIHLKGQEWIHLDGRRRSAATIEYRF